MVIRSGETLKEIFRYQDEGEVRFRAASMGGKLSLAPTGTETWERPPYEWMGYDDRFYYVRPGRYRLLLQTWHRLKPLALGHVEVRRCAVTTVEYTKPKGTIQIRIRHPVGRNWTDKFPLLVASLPANPARPPERFGNFGPPAGGGSLVWMAVTHIRPGRYRVSFTAAGWETVATEVEVVAGKTPAEVELETRQLPR